MSVSRQEFRIAVRSLMRSRGFAIVAVLSLALAIALNTTMYGVIDAMMYPPLDIRDAEHVVRLTVWGDRDHRVDPATRAALLRSGTRWIEDISYSAGTARGVALEHGRNYTGGRVTLVAPNYFRLTGARPIAGRTFVDDDYFASTPPVMLADHVAAELFPNGTLPAGATVDVDGQPHPVIGILGRGSNGDIWMLPPDTVPLAALPVNIVRLRPNISIEQASREIVALSNTFAALAGEAPKDARFQLSPSKVSQFSFKRFHVALIAAVVAVLLVACANLANLQLARGIRRSRELAVRAALGATRGDIVRQLLLESVIVAAAGLGLGLLLTLWANHLLASRIPPSIADYIIAPQTSWRVCLFAMVACALCVVLVGLLPALRVSQVDPNTLLKSGAGTGANRHNRRLYGILVAAEIGLSLALLSGAALVIRSALYYKQMHVGYDIRPLTAASFIDAAPRGTTIGYAEFENAIEDRLRHLPDVADASVKMFGHARAVTVSDSGGGMREVPNSNLNYSIVSSSVFRTYQLPIVAGRGFLDGLPSESEVVVDEPTARFLWPNGRALGERLKLGSDSSHAAWVRVVGIVKDADDELDLWALSTGARPTPKASARLGNVYYRPGASERFGVTQPFGFTFDAVIRATSDPGRMPITLRRYLAKAAPLRLLGASSMEEAFGLRRSRLRHDFVAATFLTFTLLALGLASLGIFGIVAHSVAERKRELGVRIALGANARHVLHAVLREGNVMALGGVAIGLFLTQQTAWWLSAFIFEDDQYDAPLFAAMAALLFIIALVSALIPALRATRIDPVESIRSE